MTTRTRFAIILMTVPVLAFVVVGGLLARTTARSETYPHLRVFDDVLGLTTNGYVEAVDQERLMHGAMHGLVEALDADSAYLAPDEARLASAHEAVPAGDIGLELTRQYYLRVIAARDGSPAARAGIRSGDYIRLIDRQPTRDMSVWEGVRLLRGSPGSTVTLTVLRGNAIEPHVVELAREKPAPPVVSARLADGGVAVIRVPAFSAQTPDELRSTLDRLQQNGARAVVLDVRNCASGPLEAGIAAARLFVPTGTVAVKETRSAGRETIAAEAGDGAMALPLAVLVDDGTAGPAELMAAAIAGRDRGELIGERTQGRAAVQRLHPLPDGSALWLSVAHYLTPAGEPLHERGLVPGVVVAQPEVEFGAQPPAGDPALERALERLRTRSAH